MDFIDYLLEDHESLRRSMSAMMKTLGEAKNTGWRDEASVDVEHLRDLERDFKALFKAHEVREEQLFPEAMRLLIGEGKEAVQSIQKDHLAFDDILGLLGSITSVCDGCHVYRIRTVMSRVFEELESHLAYEEAEFFPLLRNHLSPAAMKSLTARVAGTMPGKAVDVAVRVRSP